MRADRSSGAGQDLAGLVDERRWAALSGSVVWRSSRTTALSYDGASEPGVPEREEYRSIQSRAKA